MTAVATGHDLDRGVSTGSGPDRGASTGSVLNRASVGEPDRVAAALAGLTPTTLADVVASADLQTRVDRKYIVPVPTFARMLAERADQLRCLQVDGRRSFRYESVYFDTPDLICFRQHLQGRRRRFKVRTRTYLDSGECVLEVKTKGGRSQTVKSRIPCRVSDARRLTAAGRAFLTEVLPEATVEALTPMLRTSYRRATLIDIAGGRVTCDVGLRCEGGGRVAGGLVDDVLVETKSAGGPGPTDRWLWANGARPVKISKYCAAVALLWPQMRANPWHRTLRRHFADSYSPPSVCTGGVAVRGVSANNRH